MGTVGQKLEREVEANPEGSPSNPGSVLTLRKQAAPDGSLGLGEA